MENVRLNHRLSDSYFIDPIELGGAPHGNTQRYYYKALRYDKLY